MGLKEAGLRGSLRSTSSVLPAFFDVTITNTNSPVQVGDILTVDYSADNTGDAQDTQDIRLEIDSVQEDVDPGVMLSGGASATGTLEWDTTGEVATTYSATVLSDDDSDSVTVEIESPIADSAVLYIDASQHDVSDGSTVSTAPDFSGEDNDLSGAATYRSDGIGGEAAYEFDGVDDVLSRETPTVPQPLTIITVVEPFSASGRQVIFSSQDDGGDRAQFTARFDDNTYNVFAGESFEGGTPIAEPQVAVLVADGTNSFVRINGSEIASGDIGGHDWGGFKIGQRFGLSDELEGYQPEVLVADERLDTSTIEDQEQRLSDKYGISLE